MNKQRRNRIAEALELISQARDILEEVKDEEQNSFYGYRNRAAQQGCNDRGKRGGK